MSLRMLALNVILPRLARWDSHRTVELEKLREQGARFDARMPLAEGVSADSLTSPALGGVRYSAGGRSSGAVLFLHGGGYRQGSPGAGRSFSFLCEDDGPEVYSAAYRLAPEHPAPAALDDALTWYRELVASHGAHRLVVAGESAGGGLALSLVQRVISEGESPPAGVVAMFPWADLTLRGDSVRRNARRDLLTESTLSISARQYAGELPLDDPVVSPVFGSFVGFPPTVIHVGTRDLLLDDARSVASALRAVGADVTLREWENCCHGFHNLPAPEAKACRQQIRQFVVAALSDPASSPDVAPGQKR
jgi:monoterpene epsilon-lactone hydrolase